MSPRRDTVRAFARRWLETGEIAVSRLAVSRFLSHLEGYRLVSVKAIPDHAPWHPGHTAAVFRFPPMTYVVFYDVSTIPPIVVEHAPSLDPLTARALGLVFSERLCP